MMILRRQTAYWLIGASIFFSALFVIVSALRNLSSLENVLLQFFTLSLSLLGSFLLGQDSAREGARDMMKPHARSAFRRLTSLSGGLSRVTAAIEDARARMDREQFAISGLDRLEGMVTEQIVTVADALEDWGDIVPEDVAELRDNLRANLLGRSNEDGQTDE